MITVKIERNDNDEIISFSLDGHAGYDVEGKDIVCAAVSAVTNMTLIGLHEKLKLNLKVEKSDGGYIKVGLPNNIPEAEMMVAQFILESMVTEYLDIESSYGEYILVKER